MNFLITGSAGFIGHHLSRHLLADGHRVVGFDAMTPYYDVRLKEARNAILDGMPGYTGLVGQLEDMDALAAAADLAQPEVIVHLAAQAGVRYSNENPRAYVDANLVGSFNILEIARQTKPRHLLMASSSSVYGANPVIPFAESDKADDPLSFYAATKKAMESLAHSYAHLHGIPITAFRFFTVYGPYGRPDMALFKFVEAILKGQPIEVYGEGRMERDFTFIDDLIEAIVRLIDHAPTAASRVDVQGVVDSLSFQGPYRVINIGGGKPVKLMDFIATVEKVLDRPAIREMLPMQTGDVPRTYATAGLLENLTGYVPSTDIETGVRAFVDWYREFYGI